MGYTTLISVTDLASNLGNPRLVIFDCRHELTDQDFGARAYAESHLPNARFAQVDRDLSGTPTGRNGRHPLPAPEIFAAWLGDMGVNSDSQVVGYDSAGGTYAARLWWMLRWLGHDRVAVLNGGWDAWVNAGGPVTQEVPQPKRTRFAARPRAMAAVTVTYVAAHLNKPGMTLIDARSNARYHGRNETVDPIGGHIPGALNHFYKDNLDEQGMFRPADELRDAFVRLIGNSPGEQVIHQCGSGVSACHNLLAMEIAGLKGSRLYPGSWSEWIADRSRPIAT